MDYRTWLILTRIMFRKHKDKEIIRNLLTTQIKYIYETEIQSQDDLEFIEKVYESIKTIDEQNSPFKQS